MSVIFGIFNRNNTAVNDWNLQSIDDALSYWDSDDSGSWRKGSVAFGHRMLWITPDSKLDHLPRVIHSENKIFAITIDARLDDREALVEKLELEDLSLKQVTDSELVLAAYRKWGEMCPKYLLGDFVFVIWDENKQQLFCARDHIGIRPFYYYLDEDVFIFSNDIRGLISYPDVSKRYNDRSLAMFLVGSFGFYDERDTFFEAIQKMPASSSMTITKDSISESVYWDYNDITETRYDTYEEYTEKLKELLFDAVKVRLRTVYPVASHLSGGIDSSSLAVLAARELETRDQPLYAFNWVEIPDREDNLEPAEWSFAAELANLENIEQKNIKLTAEFISEMYDRIDISQDDISYFWGEYLVRDEAEKIKVRTLLSGWGGDDLISYNGYAYFSGLFRQGNCIKAIQKIRDLYKYDKKKYIWLRVIKKSIREIVYPFFYKRMPGNYREEKRQFDPFEFTQGQFSSFVKKLSFVNIGFRPGIHDEQKGLFKNGHLLHRIENWTSSSFGKKLVYVYPLLDKRIVEFALSVPEDLFARKDGVSRYFFRSAISGFLPKHIAWAGKIYEPGHGKTWKKLWDEGLKLWLQNNKNSHKDKNSYIDRLKMIKRIKVYFFNKENQIDDNLGKSRIVSSILVSNLEKRD